MLFALHPVHVEAVAGIVGRADILSGIFFLLALIFHLKHFMPMDSCNGCLPLSRCGNIAISNDHRSAHHEDLNENNNNYPDKGTLNQQENNNNHSSDNHQATLSRDRIHGFLNKRYTTVPSSRNLLDHCGDAATDDAASSDKVKGDKIPHMAWTCFYAACSMFSKEQGIAVLGVCFITEIAMLPLTSCKRGTEGQPLQQNSHRISNKHNSTKLRVEDINIQCDRSQRRMRLFILITATLILLFLRFSLMGGMKGAPSFAPADNPAASENSFITRTLTFAYLPSFNFIHLLLCPVQLSFDWSMEAVPMITSICDSRNILTAIVSMTLLLWLCKLAKHLWLLHWRNVFTFCFISQPLASSSHHREVKFISQDECSMASPEALHHAITVVSLAITILPFLPASNLFFYVGFVVAERILYIPSMGYCILVGCGLSHLWKAVECCNLFPSNNKNEKMCLAKNEEKRRNRLTPKRKQGEVLMMKVCFILLTCVFFMSFGLKTVKRNGDWIDEEKLYHSGIKINPPKGKTIMLFIVFSK